MPKKINSIDLLAPFRVIVKPIPGNDLEVLIAPFPQVKDSVVRSYRKISLDQIDEITDTGEIWSSMGRSFKVVDLRVKTGATVPLTQVLADMIDEKFVEPKTKSTLQVAWQEVSTHPKGGIYVMGSCESCWCDALFC